ncbi:MAG: US12 family protein [Planctomycetota bacterium]|nr:US12 family protein [Planctomycetota bacterium]
MREQIGALDFEQRFAALDDVKAAFVSKVYGTLAMCLIISTLAAAFVNTKMGFGIVAPNYVWLRWVPFGMLLVASFVRSLLRGIVGWCFLLTFVVAMGLVLGLVVFAYSRLPGGMELVATALGITAAIFLTLTAYVRISGKNFTYLGGFLSMATIGLLLAGFALMFFGGPTANYIYAWVGAVIFSGWILYDTSAVTHIHYHENNVVGAVLDLYIDIVQLFLFILRILGGRR